MANSATSANLKSAFSILNASGYVKRRFDFGGEYGDMHVREAGDGWHVACLAHDASDGIDLRFGAYTDDFAKAMRLTTLDSSKLAAPSLMYILPSHFLPLERDSRDSLAQTRQPPKNWLAHHIETAVHPFLLGNKTYEYSLNLLEASFSHLASSPWSRVVLLRLTGRDAQLADFAAHWRERVKGSFLPTDAFDEFIACVRAWSPQQA